MKQIMEAPPIQPLTKDQYPMMWGSDAKTFEANGDYQWMAKQIGEGSVLEVGCGIGLSTARLAKRGPLMSIDHNHNCIEATEQHLTSIGMETYRLSQTSTDPAPGQVLLLEGDVFELMPWQQKSIANFNPKWIICWLIASYTEAVQRHFPESDQLEAIRLYREKLEVALARLASVLPSVQGVHYVHRLYMPWQKKDEGRIETAKTFNQYVFQNTPFSSSKQLVLFRKWQIRNQQSGIVYGSHKPIEGAIPCLVSVLGVR